MPRRILLAGLLQLLSASLILSLSGCGEGEDEFGPTAAIGKPSGSTPDSEAAGIPVLPPIDKPEAGATPGVETPVNPLPEKPVQKPAGEKPKEPRPKAGEEKPEVTGGETTSPEQKKPAIPKADRLPVPAELISQVHASFQPGAKRLVIPSGSRATLIDIGNGKIVRNVTGPESLIAAGFLRDQETLVMVTESGLIHADSPVKTDGLDFYARQKLLRETSEKQVIQGHASRVTAFRVAPDGRSFATGDARGNVRLWSQISANASELADRKVDLLASSTTGELLVTATGDQLDFWNSESASHRAQLKLPSGAQVTALTVAQDGSLIAAGDARGRAHVWTADGTQVTEQNVSSEPIERIQLQTGQRRILIVDAEGAVRLWRLTGDEKEPLEYRARADINSPGASITALAATIPEKFSQTVNDGTGLQYKYRPFHFATINERGEIQKFLSDGKAASRARKLRHPSARLFVTRDGMHAATVTETDGQLALNLEEVDLGRSSTTISLPEKPITIAFSGTGRRIATVTESSRCQIFDRNESRFLVGVLTRRTPNAVVWGPRDESVFVLEADSRVRKYELPRLQSYSPSHDAVTAIEFSPDASQLAIATLDGQVQLFGTADGKAGRAFKTDKDWAGSLAFATESGELIAGIGNHIVIWPLTDKAEKPAEEAAPANGKPDEKPKAKPKLKVRGKKVKKDEKKEEDEAAPLPFQHPENVLSVATDEAAQFIVTGSGDGTVRVWSRKEKRITDQLKGHSDSVRHVAFNRKTKRVRTLDSAFQLRDWNFNEEIPASVRVATVPAMSSELRPKPETGETATSEASTRTPLQTLKDQLRMAATLQDRRSFRSELAAVQRRLNPSSATAPEPGDPKTPKPRRSFHREWAQSSAGESSALNPGHLHMSIDDAGELLSVIQRGPGQPTVTVIDIATGTTLRRWETPKLRSTTLELVSDSTRLLASKDFILFDLPTGQVHEFSDGAAALALSPDRKRIVVGYRGKRAQATEILKLFDLATMTELASLKGYEAAVTAVGWSPDGTQLVASIRERTIHRLMKLNTQHLAELDRVEQVKHESEWIGEGDTIKEPGISGIYFSPNSRVMITHGLYKTQKHRITTWKRRGERWPEPDARKLEHDEPLINDGAVGTPAAFVGADSTQLAVRTGETVSIIDMIRGRREASVKPESKSIRRLTANGRFFLGGNELGQIAVHDVRANKAREFSAHLGPVVALNASPNGAWLASAGEEGQLTVWALGEWLGTAEEDED